MEFGDTQSEPAEWTGKPLNRRRGYLTGVVSFGAKGVFALAITYWVANSLPPTEYALWATIFSFGTILSVADMGVGQLVLTSLHERHGVDESALISNSLAAMVLLAALMLVVTFAALAIDHSLDGVWSTQLLAVVILLRLLFIPHGAYLMALERYHERKFAEALSYGVAAVFVFVAVRAGANVSVLLLGLNAIITIGSLGIAIRATQLRMPRARLASVSRTGLGHVFRESFPYFVNNVSGLAIYGGFIALSSFVLRPVDLARLSLLHTVLFMHLYQVFELIFRSVQPRMREPGMMRRLRVLVGGSFLLGLLISGVVGAQIAALLFHNYRFTPAELMVYTVFVFLEVWYLMQTSRMQMRSSLKKNLQWMSIAKALAFLLVLAAAELTRDSGLQTYAILLSVYSAAMALMAWRLGGPRSETMAAASTATG